MTCIFVWQVQHGEPSWVDMYFDVTDTSWWISWHVLWCDRYNLVNHPECYWSLFFLTFQCIFGYQINTNITEHCLLPNIVSSSDITLWEIEGSFVMFNKFRRKDGNISRSLTRDSVMEYLFAIMLLLGMTHTRFNTSGTHIVYNLNNVFACIFFNFSNLTYFCS